MSCVIGLPHQGAVTLGADSLATGGESLREGEGHLIDFPKVWRQGSYLIGCCGTLRALQAVRYGVELPEPPADGELAPFLYRELVPRLRTALLEAEVRGAVPGCPMGYASLLLATRGELWEVGGDLSLIPCSSYTVIGSGHREAYGALYVACKLGLDGREAVELALEASAETSLGVAGPWTLVSTAPTAPLGA